MINVTWEGLLVLKVHSSDLTFCESCHICVMTLYFPFSFQNSCSDLDVYLRGPLSQYLLNVSTAAELCSQTLCASNGRCLRKNPDSDVYLHLNPLTHSIISQGGKQTVNGELGEAEKTSFQAEFQCQCYSGYHGERCDQRDTPSQATSLSAQKYVILLIISLLLC